MPISSLLSERPKQEAPGRKLHPVLRLSALSGDRELVWMRQGLIPSYACDDRGAEQRAEAHAEAITSSASFRSSFRRRRCLIPADVLNERRHLSSGIEHPCSFSLESGGVFGIAGIWETWTNDQGHAVESFAIISTLVTPILRSLFGRMPVVLTGGHQFDRWLHAARQEQPPIDLLRPLSVSELRAWTITPAAVEVNLNEVDPCTQRPAVHLKTGRYK